jgi:hypothetical protein
MPSREATDDGCFHPWWPSQRVWKLAFRVPLPLRCRTQGRYRAILGIKSRSCWESRSVWALQIHRDRTAATVTHAGSVSEARQGYHWTIYGRLVLHRWTPPFWATWPSFICTQALMCLCYTVSTVCFNTNSHSGPLNIANERSATTFLKYPVFHFTET